jgi:hypothetical protein
MPPGEWQLAQFSARSGAISPKKVGGFGAQAARPNAAIRRRRGIETSGGESRDYNPARVGCLVESSSA